MAEKISAPLTEVQKAVNEVALIGYNAIADAKSKMWFKATTKEVSLEEFNEVWTDLTAAENKLRVIMGLPEVSA